MRKAREETAADVAVVERVAVPSESGIVAIDAIAKLCNMDHNFSAREEFTRPWTRVWVARETGPHGETLAFLVAWHVADELHILNIATTPMHQRRGVATALMAESVAYARAQRVRVLFLEVRRSNRAALRLYRKLGFTAMGMRPRYYADNDEDAIEMVLALDPATGVVLPGRDEIRIDG